MEQQEEELEVLRSIYEGDEQFKELSITCFQYMYGSGENKSILLEISWPEAYPSVVPVVNLGKCTNMIDDWDVALSLYQARKKKAAVY